jgi:hypothetical protein
LTIKKLVAPEAAANMDDDLEPRTAPIASVAEPPFYEIIDGVLFSERKLGTPLRSL